MGDTGCLRQWSPTRRHAYQSVAYCAAAIPLTTFVRCIYSKPSTRGRQGFVCTTPLSIPATTGLPTMMKNFEDFQKFGQFNMDATIKAFGEGNKGGQAIAAEMGDYTKRSFEESTATFEKLLSAKSVEQAVEIQTGFAKRAYDGYMHQLSKIGGMYAELAKEAYRPVERALGNSR